jgi:hypothetical protein
MTDSKDTYIYLVFTRTGTWLSKLIRVFSNIEYPHSSISFDGSFTKMYTFGRTNANNPFSGGFIAENIYEGVYKKYSGSECLIYRVKVSKDQFEQLENEIDNFKKDKEIYRYNFLGLFGVLLNQPLDRKKHYFCSQFVSKVLINSNIYDNDKSPGLIRTNELLEIDNKVKIYEGCIDSTRLPIDDTDKAIVEC